VDFDVLDRQTGKELDKTLSFNVEIKDKNDNKPEFLLKTIHIPVQENTVEGSENTYYCIYAYIFFC